MHRGNYTIRNGNRNQMAHCVLSIESKLKLITYIYSSYTFADHKADHVSLRLYSKKNTFIAHTLLLIITRYTSNQILSKKIKYTFVSVKYMVIETNKVRTNKYNNKPSCKSLFFFSAPPPPQTWQCHHANPVSSPFPLQIGSLYMSNNGSTMQNYTTKQ